MNTNVNPARATGATAPGSRQRGKRVALAATLLVSGAVLFSGFGLAAGTAQAAPGPFLQRPISDGLPFSAVPLDYDKKHPTPSPGPAPQPPPQPQPPSRDSAYLMF
jgi:hypothetical protein